MQDDHINKLIDQIAFQEDKKSFEELFLHFYDHLYRFAYSYLHNREAAEEIVSDVFLSIWQKRKNLHLVQNFKVYLYVVVKNHALNYLKKYKRAPFLSIDEISHEVSTIGNSENELISRELRKEIDEAIENLPPRCRVIFELIRLDGLKYKEVAEVLDISVKTVEGQIKIAMQKLATKLANHFQNRKNPNINETLLLLISPLLYIMLLNAGYILKPQVEAYFLTFIY